MNKTFVANIYYSRKKERKSFVALVHSGDF